MGNFSRDTFDRLKHYVSVRLQQGVPLVDSDWNELQDIRKHELEELLRLFVGDGVPMGDDGFAIGSVAGGNDFSIAAGHCLVKGWSVVNESAVRYTEQTDAPPLEPPATGERVDTVYLDVWEREVDSEENPDLVNPEIGIETCVRTKREWVVRVAEGATSLPAPPAGHLFYPLATLNRKAEQEVIDDVTDLRRTGLNLAALKIYVDAEGNVGIGEKNPGSRLSKLVVSGSDNSSRVLIEDGTGSIAIGHWDGKYVGINSAGRPLLIDSHEGGIRLVNKYKEEGDLVIDTQGNVGVGTSSPHGKLDVRGHLVLESGQDPFIFGGTGDQELSRHLQLLNSPNYGSTLGLKAGSLLVSDFYGDANPRRNDLIVKGNVGIGTVATGTVSPAAKLDIRGSNKQGTYHLDDGQQEDLRVLSGANEYLEGGTIAIGGCWGPTGYIKTAARNGTAGDLIIGNRRSPSATRMEPGIFLQYDGKVGIGTTSPAKKLHIQGVASGPLWNDTSDRPGIAITGEYPELDLFSVSGNRDRGATIRLGAYTDDTESSFKHWAIGTAGRNTHFLDFGFSDLNEPFPHYGIRDYGGKTVLTLAENGNVGIGTLSPTYKLQVEGQIYAPNSGVAGSDYAEYFESVTSKEIPVATSVVLEKGRIRPAKQGEEPVGIISANPGVVGGIHPEWPKKYLRDEFGNMIMESHKEEVMAPKKEKVTRERQKVKKKTVEEQATRTEIVLKGRKYLQKEITETVTREVDEPVFEEVDLYDASGKTVIGKHRVAVMETYEEEIDVLDDEGRPVLVGTGKFETKERPKLNPDYDEAKEYVPREKRPEWNCVGLLGKLPLRKGQPVAASWIKMKDITDEVELWLVK